jgi:hypothetical protein
MSQVPQGTKRSFALHAAECRRPGIWGSKARRIGDRGGPSGEFPAIERPLLRPLPAVADEQPAGHRDGDGASPAAGRP